ncbi:MAG: lipid-A-disaccharide synthase [Candidatus Cloacimonadota bacterium]|nr:MAG: lipid-A-disaccharide synthase [Candidatus Cloacimonadota bacterium]
MQYAKLTFLDKGTELCYRMVMVKIFIITGEASGDLHASFLIRELRKGLPGSMFYGVGGMKMQEEGVHLFFGIEHLSVIGFWEVVKKLNTIKRILRSLVAKMREMKPDALILIDSPGFNLRLAPFARMLGIKVFYYITPQVWAWGGWRLRSMYKNVDYALVIFPFEKQIFKSYGINTFYVGHPIIDEMALRKNREDFCKEHALNPEKPIVALLPGSREGEIRRILPVMLSISDEIKKRKPEIQFILPTIYKEMKALLHDRATVKMIYGETSDGINAADAAVAASGTVTLETAFLRTPCVIIYKVSILSYLIAKWLIKVPYIGLVNIVRGKKIVPEYTQFSIKVHHIATEILRMLDDKEYAMRIKSELDKVITSVGKKGASENAAQIIVAKLDEEK